MGQNIKFPSLPRRGCSRFSANGDGATGGRALNDLQPLRSGIVQRVVPLLLTLRASVPSSNEEGSYATAASVALGLCFLAVAKYEYITGTT